MQSFLQMPCDCIYLFTNLHHLTVYLHMVARCY